MIQLSYSISPNRQTLIVVADDKARAELRELFDEKGEAFASDACMIEAFEHMMCNNGGELCWISPCDTGDLTDAPILGIYSERSTLSRPIVSERWGYMNYQVRSPLHDLLDNGRAVFVAP